MKRLALVLGLTVGVVSAVGLQRSVELELGRPEGNPTLVATAKPLLGGGRRHHVSIALVTADSTRFARFGGEPLDEFEVASLTKPMTGALLAQAVEHGEARYDTPVGEILEELDGSRVGRVTLEDLATYHAGLSLWGPDRMSPRRWFVEHVLAGNPRGIDRDEMLSRARSDQMVTVGRFSYSNLAFALLGAALSEVAGQPFDQLIEERLFEPLGMDATRIGRSGDRNQRRGYTASGRRSAPWNLDSFAPAGGVRSTIEDMAIWARSLVTGRTVGPEAMDTFRSDGDRGVGLGWYTLVSDDGHDVIWKSGLTGGFASFAAVDRTAGVAVVVLSDTGTPFDESMLALLEAQ